MSANGNFAKAFFFHGHASPGIESTSAFCNENVVVDGGHLSNYHTHLCFWYQKNSYQFVRRVVLNYLVVPRKFIAKKRCPCVRGKIPITQDAVVKDRFESCPACGRNSDRILTVSLRNISWLSMERCSRSSGT